MGLAFPVWYEKLFSKMSNRINFLLGTVKSKFVDYTCNFHWVQKKNKEEKARTILVDRLAKPLKLSAINFLHIRLKSADLFKKSITKS